MNISDSDVKKNMASEQILPLEQLQHAMSKAAYTKLDSRMKDIATIVFEKFKNMLEPTDINNFQVFSIDFILDKNANPYLLKIHTNPDFSAPNNLL